MSAEKTKSDANQSSDRSSENTKRQFDNAVLEPVRAYGVLTTDYFEKLFSVQFDSVRAFADKNLAQSRSWLEVKDSDSFRQVIEQQQQAVRELSEQMKEDADRIQALSQDYLKETQQLTSESMQSGSKQLEENMQKGKAQVESHFQKGKEEMSDAQQKSQRQADNSKKSASTSDK
ncbi:MULTISPECIES: phasin family protein [Halomonas]|uniref:Phasin protein n=1 Tax=Halomonas chromatireducens TaxID=507626 RepID=A0A109UKT1_9GAMM|nr:MULTISPECIES: phasin family protein [Halomonas]AMC99436.1 Phasin protein [Halomonas chromatireducens]MBZ0329677.1 phasin family protein [Halomonas sp. ANAO-440]